MHLCCCTEVSATCVQLGVKRTELVTYEVRQLVKMSNPKVFRGFKNFVSLRLRSKIVLNDVVKKITKLKLPLKLQKVFRKNQKHQEKQDLTTLLNPNMQDMHIVDVQRMQHVTVGRGGSGNACFRTQFSRIDMALSTGKGPMSPPIADATILNQCPRPV